MKSSKSLLAISPIGLGVVAMALLDPGFSELKNFAPTIVLAFLMLWTVVKLTPTWREVKMREMDVREKEIDQRVQQSLAIQSLADVTERIALEQRHATEALQIAERVNVREGEKLGEIVHEIRDTVQTVSARVDAIDAKAAEAKA